MDQGGWRRSLAVVLLAALVLLAGPLLVVEDALQPAGAVLVIGGDHKPERIQRAAELYFAGDAPLIILSAGTLVYEGNEQVIEAEVMRQQALALGIPANALILETESRTTYRNATYSKQLLQQLGFDEILLVTSVYHSRRARRIF
ncbi:MAG: YdcF family protein, partial [Anaerolineales bacterium]